MAINRTFDYAVSPSRGERGGGDGYINPFTESLEIDGVGRVAKSESPNVADGWNLAGRGCSVMGCTWSSPKDIITPAEAARAFCLHNADYHNEEHANHVVYLWQRVDPDDQGVHDGFVWSA